MSDGVQGGGPPFVSAIKKTASLDKDMEELGKGLDVIMGLFKLAGRDGDGKLDSAELARLVAVCVKLATAALAVQGGERPACFEGVSDHVAHAVVSEVLAGYDYDKDCKMTYNEAILACGAAGAHIL